MSGDRNKARSLGERHGALLYRYFRGLIIGVGLALIGLMISIPVIVVGHFFGIAGQLAVLIVVLVLAPLAWMDDA